MNVLTVALYDSRRPEIQSHVIVLILWCLMRLKTETKTKKKKKNQEGKKKRERRWTWVFLGGVLLWQLELSIFKRKRRVFLGRNGGVWSEHASGFVAFPGVIPGRQVALSAQWRGSGHSRAPQPLRLQLVFHVVTSILHTPLFALLVLFLLSAFIHLCFYIYFYLCSIVFKIAVRPRGQLSAFHCPFIVGKNAMNKNLNVTCWILLPSSIMYSFRFQFLKISSLVCENPTCAWLVVWWRCFILPMHSFSNLKSAEFQQRHFIGPRRPLGVLWIMSSSSYLPQL